MTKKKAAAPVAVAPPAKKKRKPGPGRGHKHKPLPENRKIVEALAGYGISQEDIGVRIGISVETLVRYYRREYELGVINANAAVVQSLHRQAVGAAAEYDAAGNLRRAELAPVPSAGIWWTKARMGWKEVTIQRHSGEEGGAAIPVRLDSLTDAQLEQFVARIDKRLAGGR